jgi:hypothetical protein
MKDFENETSAAGSSRGKFHPSSAPSDEIEGTKIDVYRIRHRKEVFR